MIKIIKGSYGKKDGKVIKPVYTGETVELTPDQEARLVKLGVAEYVEDRPDEGANVEAPELPEYSESMKLAELIEVAAKYGVDASGAKSKKEVIAAIEEAKDLPGAAADDTVVDG